MNTGLMDDGYDTLSLLPLAVRRSVMVAGPKVKPAVPQAVQDLVRALKAPKRALTGEIDVNSPEGVQEALNVGLMSLGAGTAFSAGRSAPKGALATITTVDRAPWATPIAAGGGKPGQKLVFMSDSDFRIPRKVQDRLLEHGEWSGPLGEAAQGKVMTVHPEILQHPTTLRLRPGGPVEGSFSHNSKEVLAVAPRLEAEIMQERLRRPIGRDPGTLESVLLHETNHAVQQLLGMDPGTSPNTLLQNYRNELGKILRLGLAADEEKVRTTLKALPRFKEGGFDAMPEGPLKDAIFQRYMSTYGEENARLAQKLMGLTDEELRKNRLSWPAFYNKPVSEQLPSNLSLGGLMSVAPPVRAK